MNKNININEKKLDDPLNEITLPNFSRLGINHHSPTQASMTDGIYLFRYIICDQETRRLFEGNSNMAAGVCTGEALANHYSDDIWKFNPSTKKLQPQKNEKLTQEVAIQKALDKFSDYNPVSDVDRDKFEHYKETIPQTIRQGFLACETLGALKAKKISAEDSINFIDKRLQLPLVGRTDLILQDFYGDEQSSSEVLHRPFLSVLEFKTVWDKPMKIRKDGSRSFSNAKLPSIPHINHLKQISFYHSAARPVVSKLVYLTADGFKVFDKNNCTDLEPVNLNNYYNQLIRTAKRRERLLRRYDHINDTDRIKKELILDTSGGFDHPFYWKIGNRFVQHAKELWSQ